MPVRSPSPPVRVGASRPDMYKLVHRPVAALQTSQSPLALAGSPWVWSTPTQEPVARVQTFSSSLTVVPALHSPLAEPLPSPTALAPTVAPSLLLTTATAHPTAV